MFADSLLESNLDRTNRGWTTLASFAMQTLGVAILLMLPVLYTEGLPRLHLLSVSAPIGPPRGEPPAAQQHSAIRQGQSNLFHGIVVLPPSIPIGVKPIIDDSLPQVEACNVCVPGGTDTGNGTNSIIDSIGVAPAVVPPPPPPTAHPPRISHMNGGQPDLQSAANLSAIGARSTNSGSGCNSGHHQPQGHYRKSADPDRPPHARRRRARCRAPMALPSLHPERRAGGSRNPSDREFLTVRRLAPWENGAVRCGRRASRRVFGFSESNSQKWGLGEG